MYSGELEIQAKRKALAVLQDEITKLLNTSRDLSSVYSLLLKGDSNGLQEYLEKIQNTEEVENLRRRITRDVSEIGNLMMNREDILRTAYLMDEIRDYMSGIAFKLSVLKPSVLKKELNSDVQSLIDIVIEELFRLNEMARALSMNPIVAIEIASTVQKLERQVDEKYRMLTIRALNDVSGVKDVLLLKDVLEGIEGMADKCLETSDSFTILALNM
ncbi:MAG: phosphate transport regulator [Thaumarchaeota archaeon]|nr:phosphate transport regulator [Nitrososphaerota archaeon]|tara:strand:+ start:46 stop:693 length:648 start_codon:yes stop_codon:yes gene_type:complete